MSANQDSIKATKSCSSVINRQFIVRGVEDTKKMVGDNIFYTFLS